MNSLVNSSNIAVQVSSKHIITKLYFDIGGEAEAELSVDPDSLQVSESQKHIQAFFFSFVVHQDRAQWVEWFCHSVSLCVCPLSPRSEWTRPDKGTFKH